MAEDKNKKPEELSDEQLDEVTGGSRSFKESMFNIRNK